MRINPVPLIAALLCAYTSFAQVNERYRITLNNSSFVPEKNIATDRLVDVNKQAKTANKSFLVIQFESMPTETVRQGLKRAGIELLEYIPNYAFTAVVTGNLSASILNTAKARAVVELSPRQKMQPTLAAGIVPTWASKAAGTVDVWITYPASFPYDQVLTELKLHNIEILPSIYQSYHIAALRLPISKLEELAALPFVSYVQAAPKADEILNYKSVVNTKANVLQSALPGGRNLSGNGVVIGIGDDSDPMVHIDYRSRIINHSSQTFGTHGVHVMGTAAGAGIVDERYAGYAPKSTVVSQVFSNILAYSAEYVQDHGMVITNNSYGNITNDCKTFGVYDLYSKVVDDQAFQMPNLQHVFASGNSGAMNCAPYPVNFGTLLGSYQTAKNSISVGNINEIGVISPSSSRGPARDGRLKPEIVAQGVSVMSTWPYDSYVSISGTSMSAPAVSGGLALLYERYRQLNGNANPVNRLMKALLINGATDIGNPGPDYTFGFGWMNLVRSVKMLENNTYFESSVNAGSSNTHTINIPAGPAIAQLKVMLYWNDSSAVVLAPKALVNDLDLEVTNPSAVTIYPQLLDTLPANVNNAATTGPDHFNNIEQVVINNPVPGNYNFIVKGTTIPFAGQHSYSLVFDTIPVSATLTYPVGGEHFEPGETFYISWDAFGNPANTFTLEYSTDNGTSWTTITTNAAAGSRLFSWTTPVVATDLARIRLTQNVTGLQSVSEKFAILGKPVITLAAVQCPGYIAVNWTAVSGATDYEIMLSGGGDLRSVGTTAATNFTVPALSPDTLYWITVRPRIGAVPGRRAIAISLQPNSGTCTGAISNNDLKLETIVTPRSSGRKFTSTELTTTTGITIRIRNLDDAAITGNIPVRYIIGAGLAVNETIVGANISAGGFIDYLFTATADLSAIGTYNLTVSVSNTGDPVSANDTLKVILKQLDNPAINLATVFVDDIEAAPVQEHTSPQVGLIGLDRYDFVNSSLLGRIRTFVNTGIAYSGTKALTLDASRYILAGVTDSLTGTFNLTGYNTATDDIRLDFRFKHHGQSPNGANNVWIRGDDTKPWVLAYDLYANQDDPGVFVLTKSIEARNLLVANSQNFSSSFQVRWGQWGQVVAADNNSASGYTFDNIRVYRVTDDIQMISIDTPSVSSCNLNSTTPVRISIRNSSNATITSIPVFLEVDGATPVSEIIASIPANTIVTYTFTATANLSTPGVHTVRVWSDLGSDNFPDNDSATVNVYNSLLVTSFPYLQNFESSDGGWHADGKKSSWIYGTPASPKINGAASGVKAWKTNLLNTYNDAEFSYLYSPCFNISGLVTPMLSLSVALDLEDCGGSLCDAGYMEYSADGVVWSRLGTMGAGTNWYNKNYAGDQVWSVQNYTRWHVASIPLPAGLTQLRLRFVLKADPYVAREGIAIDDIHIYDRQFPIYEGAPFTSPAVNQPVVTGTSWIDFVDAGEIILSVNPNGQNMGSTDAQVYINTGAVRNRVGQYYHDRNITIKPATTALTDSVTVRFYFLDSETEALINATGCSYCTKPAMANQLGISKYSSTNDALENGTLTDNIGLDWLFITARNAVKVPYDRGYYAEFKVKDFSEFWLNNGGTTNNQSLPVELTSFTAKKVVNGDVLLEWITASEMNTSRFEVELARGDEEFRLGHFIKFGEVSSFGNSTTEQHYQLTDAENNKSATRYYRLKIVDLDGRFTYSAVRPVLFEGEAKWQVYPNPSTGIFNAIFQAESGRPVAVRVLDMNGKEVTQVRTIASGFQQRMILDLGPAKYTPGMYMVQIVAGEKIQAFNVLKK